MPKINHGRIKPKYSPVPNAQERRHMSRVMERGCLVCGGRAIAHHILQHSQSKRWRRDHQQVVPLCDRHHVELHTNGNEIAWQEGYGLDLSEEAQMLRLESVMEGIL